MPNEIVNRVAQSDLVALDLGDFYPKEKVITLDIKPWLFQGLLLKEKDFRQNLKDHDWMQYQGKLVSVVCSSDAIIPSWAYMLIATHLEGIAADVGGSEAELISRGFERAFTTHNFSQYANQAVIMKGCGFGPTPPSVYMSITKNLKPYAKSIMFGEPCSTVPVYKKAKKQN